MSTASLILVSFHLINFSMADQLYVHRSGRTARAAASGLSMMLVGPDDMKTYRQICYVLRSGAWE